ncbi:DUF5011 domain-containing protein [Flavobacteriaceae bacterium]|nr:DUF5011 domain-containing protein [Flavobacteriaceae bacterium]
MKKKYFLISIFTLFSFLTYAQGPWNFNGSNDIWESTGTSANLTSGASFSTLDVNGAGNPMLRTFSANINASAVTHVVITLKNNTANKHMRVFYQTTGTNRYVNVAITANDADFVTYYVDMTGNADWTGTVNDLTFQFRENSSYNSALDGTIDIDNIEMTSSDLGVNMVNNSSFENWNDDTEATPVDPVGFYKHESVERSSDSHSGDYSIKVIATTTRDLAQTVNEITAGATYRVSINYKLEANTGSGVRLWSTWKDASNANLASLDLQPSGYLNTVSSEWATFSVDAVAPENATKMNFEVRAYNGATVYWDSFSVSKVQEPVQPLLITTSVCSTATSVRLTGPWWGWDPAGGPEAADNGDGTWTFTFDPAPTDNMEYLLVVDGVQENLISIMANGGDCAPVTDYANYANRRWDLGTGDVTNTYGQCGSTCVAPVITLTGTDVTINNGDTYTDAGATASDDEEGDITANIVLGGDTVDTNTDGTYTITYDVSDGAGNAATTVSRVVTVETPVQPLLITTSVCSTATAVRLTGPWWGWDPAGGPEAADNGDGTWTFTFDPAPTDNMEYLLVVDGVQENLISIMANGGDCAPVTDYANYANRRWDLGTGDVTNTYGQCGSTCVAPVITLTGTDVTINNGDTYTDAGATASDDEEGDITANIVLGGDTVDTNTDGTYTITYDVSDGAGNAATTVSRVVTVETPLVCTNLESFESFPPLDWTLTSSNTSNSITQSTSYSVTGDNSLRFSSLSSAATYDQYAVTPKLVTTAGDQTISFWYKGYSFGTERFKVGWSSTGNDVTTDFTWSDEITATTTGVQFTKTDLPEGTTYVAIHYYSPYQYYMYVDDFCTPALFVPDCVAPNTLVASNITSSSADISWTSDATNFNVEYGAEGFTQGSGTTDTSAIASYSLTGLSSNTSYDIYVQTNCGSSGVSEWAGPYTFVTGCGAVTAFPYTEDFDTDWSCWTVVNVDSDSYTWSQSSTYISPRSGLYTAHGMGSNDDYLISPKFTLTGNERVVWYDIVESSTYNNTYDVLISTTGKNIADFTTNLGTYDCTNTSWEEHILDLSMYTGDVYIALHQTYSAATFYGFGVDDFTVEEIPACSAPTALSAASITATSADISWVSDGTSFNIEYGPEGFTPGSGTTDTSTTTSYSLSGLSSNTTYDVYVQNDCGSNGTSEMVLVTLTSNPACGDTVTYCYDNGLNSVFSATVDNVGDYITVSIIEGDTESCCDDLIIYDSSDDSGNELYRGAGDLTGVSITSTTGIISVWVDADGSVSCLDPSSWSGLPSTSLVMDVTCAPPPTCIDPSDLTVASITSTSANISWTSDDSTFNVEVVDVTAGGTATGTATYTGVTSPYSLSGLDSNTEYEVYVQTDCGSGDTSAWAGPVSFTTPIVPDYTNDFATFPDLWSKAGGDLATGPSGTTLRWVEDTFANDGVEPALRFNVYSTNTGWLITPMFDLSSGVFYLNVDAAAVEWASTTVDAIWGSDDFATLMASTDGGSTWVELYRWDGSNNPGVAGAAMPEITLNNYTATSKFAFYGESSVPNEDVEFFIDNFQITTTSLGVDDNQISLFNYFPNPVKDVLTIKAQNNVEDVKVFNMLGQMVLRQNPNSRDCTVDLSTMQTGAYFVQVSIGNTVETVRILKN